jgi:hypothetical protein
MSPEEARELLNSLKSDARHMPVQPLADNTGENAAADQSIEDW